MLSALCHSRRRHLSNKQSRLLSRTYLLRKHDNHQAYRAPSAAAEASSTRNLLLRRSLHHHQPNSKRVKYQMALAISAASHRALHLRYQGRRRRLAVLWATCSIFLHLHLHLLHRRSQQSGHPPQHHQATVKVHSICLSQHPHQYQSRQRRRRSPATWTHGAAAMSGALQTRLRNRRQYHHLRHLHRPSNRRRLHRR